MAAERIKTGVPGLNRLLEGGLHPHTVTVINGPAGAGKTTISTQFIRRGLYDGRECIFVSLDETKDQIIGTAKGMGFSDIMDYVRDERLFFIDVSGKSFRDYISDELPQLISEWKTADAIIAIDPLTPVIWSAKELYEQREIVSTLFKMMKRIGTVLCTLEEHSHGMGGEVVVPTYLADTAIRLWFSQSMSPSPRSLKIVKSRNTHHSQETHTYGIVKGFGVVVRPQPLQQLAGSPGHQIAPEAVLQDARLSGLQGAQKARVSELLRLASQRPSAEVAQEDVIEGILDEFAH